MRKEFNYWQNCIQFHPLTCKNSCGKLKYRKHDMMYCKVCGYEQEISNWHKNCLKEAYKNHKVKISPYFKWFDFWIGWFFDTNKQVLYIGLIPMFGIKIEL